jgi:hypothetical protein
MSWIEEAEDFNDFCSYLVLYAPDSFPVEDYLPPHEQMNLEKAFAELFAALPLLREVVGSDQQLFAVRAKLVSALEAYRAGADRQGAILLQELQYSVWPLEPE